VKEDYNMCIDKLLQTLFEDIYSKDLLLSLPKPDSPLPVKDDPRNRPKKTKGKKIIKEPRSPKKEPEIPFGINFKRVDLSKVGFVYNYYETV